MTRDTRAVIDLSALRHNLSVAKQYAADSRLMAVIKANGYGHGLLPVASALNAADGFAVTGLEEAIPLRKAGFHHPILLLQGLYAADELSAVVEFGLQVVVHSWWQIEILARARLPGPISVWLKVDSGMHRLGFRPEDVKAAYLRLQHCKVVARHIRLMTHFAAADDRDNEYTEYQTTEFYRACEGLLGERSMANSAGVLGWPKTLCDWVRPGIMLYGASPFADARPSPPSLRPVMTLRSRVVAIQRYPRGARIGYAGTFECPEDMSVGVITIGYGDGYPRHVRPGTPVLIRGCRVPIVGRVSMDMLCVDLRGYSDVQVNDLVTLWGEGLPADEIAAASGTIAYELFCQVTRRVHFEYLDQLDG